MLDKGLKRESKLIKDVYFSDQYFSKQQLFSLSEQINLLYTYCKKFTDPNILEVGKGNGFVADFFKKANFNIKTFDINDNLEPDIVGNILDLSTLISTKSDVILCSEVLEHIDFDYFETSLEQLRFAANKYVIITLPEFKKFFGVNMQIRVPKLKVFSFPLFFKIRGNKQLGSGHFWEIGYSQETSRFSIEKIITKYFTIIDKGYFHTNPYHNFYVLEVK